MKHSHVVYIIEYRNEPWTGNNHWLYQLCGSYKELLEKKQCLEDKGFFVRMDVYSVVLEFEGA